MSISRDTPRDNLTLSESDLAACHPIVGEGGHVLRARCPFHGSDRQRSLRVQVHSGRFVCFACGAWGYMDTARAQWREEQQRQAAFRRPPARRQRMPHRRQSPPPRSRPPAAAAKLRSAGPPAPRAYAPYAASCRGACAGARVSPSSSCRSSRPRTALLQRYAGEHSRRISHHRSRSPRAPQNACGVSAPTPGAKRRVI